VKKGEPVDRSALVPVDHSVPVLRVTDAQGKVAAVLFGYACHNTTTPIYHYNGDYAGYAQIALEASHPGAMKNPSISSAVTVSWAGVPGPPR